MSEVSDYDQPTRAIRVFAQTLKPGGRVEVRFEIEGWDAPVIAAEIDRMGDAMTDRSDINAMSRFQVSTIAALREMGCTVTGLHGRFRVQTNRMPRMVPLSPDP